MKDKTTRDKALEMQVMITITELIRTNKTMFTDRTIIWCPLLLLLLFSFFDVHLLDRDD